MLGEFIDAVSMPVNSDWHFQALPETHNTAQSDFPKIIWRQMLHLKMLRGLW